MGRAAVFLDRDGTMVRDVNYMRSPGQLRLLPRAGAAIRRLNENGFAVVITTNQSGVARGLLTEADLAEIHSLLERRLARYGAHIDGIYYCPHHPDVGAPKYRRRCRCRKPAPGMLLRAARDLNLALERSFAVGDTRRDIEAGRRAGCRTVLVGAGRTRTGTGTSEPESGADHVAADLFDAASWILAQHRLGGGPT
jgi:D-glycero-D-manno-heptose 1,7-bisphosphate phosphatase